MQHRRITILCIPTFNKMHRKYWFMCLYLSMIENNKIAEDNHERLKSR